MVLYSHMNPDQKNPKMPKTEQQKSIESIPDIDPLKVIEAFKQFGGESEQGMELYKKWYDQQYEQLVAGKINAFQLNWLVGSLQFTLGKYEEAYTTFEDLAGMLKQEGDTDTMNKCYDMADKVWEEYETKKNQ